jgi:hypothetical protein
MATQDRNRSKYGQDRKEFGFLDLTNRETWIPDLLEKAWKTAAARRPIKTSYDAIDTTSLSGEATADALELLFEVTGDEAFRTALLALRGHGLHKGGLKENLKRKLRGKLNARPAIRYAMSTMAGWRRRVRSDREAARLTAAQMGIPGQSFDAAVDELRKAYVQLKKLVETGSNEPADDVFGGDTGRKLKVRMATPWSGLDGKPLNTIRGVEFGESALGVVPDDAWWRRAIHEGRFELCGVIERQVQVSHIWFPPGRDSRGSRADLRLNLRDDDLVRMAVLGASWKRPPKP